MGAAAKLLAEPSPRELVVRFLDTMPTCDPTQAEDDLGLATAARAARAAALAEHEATTEQERTDFHQRDQARREHAAAERAALEADDAHIRQLQGKVDDARAAHADWTRKRTSILADIDNRTAAGMPEAEAVRSVLKVLSQ